MAYALFMLDT